MGPAWQAHVLGFQLMTDRKRCGPHVEVAKTSNVRVTRCACGAVHLALLAKGVTVQLSDGEFAAIARDLGAAADEAEATAEATASARPSERIN